MGKGGVKGKREERREGKDKKGEGEEGRRSEGWKRREHKKIRKGKNIFADHMILHRIS